MLFGEKFLAFFCSCGSLTLSLYAIVHLIFHPRFILISIVCHSGNPLPSECEFGMRQKPKQPNSRCTQRTSTLIVVRLTLAAFYFLHIAEIYVRNVYTQTEFDV